MHQHTDAVQQQFSPQAQAYLASTVHAQGPDLQYLQDWLGQHTAPLHNALDIGCGAGHVSYLLARHARQVTAYDPSPAMLEVVHTQAQARSLHGLRTVCGHAEALPFATHSMDMVCTRYSAHHWSDVPAALQEVRRVLRPGGYLCVIDILGGDTPLLDSHIQTLELLRDTSHVRDYSSTEWCSMLHNAGFAITQQQRWPLRLEFSSWITRMRTPVALVQAMRTLQSQACAEVQSSLALEADGSFAVHTGLWCARVSE